jgi:hypothetical protein
MNTRANPAPNPRLSRPSGPLVEAQRVWADHVHMLAKLAAKGRAPLAPQLIAGTDMADWRSHMSPREWAVIRELIRAGIWEPEEDDG